MKYLTFVLIIFLFSIQTLAGTNTVHIYKCKYVKNSMDRNDMNGGYYFKNKETNEVVGFALNRDYMGTMTVVELSEKEYYDYICDMKIVRNDTNICNDKKIALASKLLDEKKNPSFIFLNREVKNADDIKRIVKEKVNELLINRLENNELNLIMLLFAYMDKIQFNQIGISNINTETDANAYLNDFFNNVVKEMNNIKKQSKQFIKDNNLN